MVISKNSQLGLMLWERNMMLEYLEDSKLAIEKEKERAVANVDEAYEEYGLTGAKDSVESVQMWNDICSKIGYDAGNKGAEFYTIPHPSPYQYLIMPSVETCAEMIRLKENFSCAMFSKIRDGEHVYLLGKDEFYRFVKFNGAIRGSYWNRQKRIAFETGFLFEADKYYFPHEYTAEFNRLVRLMTFIELGDTEVIMLESGRNNGKSKKAGKITNTSNFTVYVVDSSWNQLIIRTDGFAVRGHYRLQPCGTNLAERKLI